MPVTSGNYLNGGRS